MITLIPGLFNLNWFNITLFILAVVFALLILSVVITLLMAAITIWWLNKRG